MQRASSVIQTDEYAQTAEGHHDRTLSQQCACQRSHPKPQEQKMRKSILAAEMLAALLLSSTAARSQCVTQFSDQLYGLYVADDGGRYHVRQIGNDVWWTGDSPDNRFKNVFHGQISGNILKGGWLDVPVTDHEFPTNAGQVTLQIAGDHESFKKLNSPTGPHSASWRRSHSCPDTN
jgi:hypothetical protein